MRSRYLLVVPLLAVYLQAASVNDLSIALNDWGNPDGGYWSINECNPTATGEMVIPSKIKSVSGPNHYLIAGQGTPVEKIENFAFQSCTGLTSITIPDSVTSIGYLVFRNCNSVTSVTIGNSVTSNSVTSIGSSAFVDCSSLTNVTIGSNVTFNGRNAFQGCSSLSNITILDNVTSFGLEQFYGRGVEIIVSELNTTYKSIDGCLFSNDGTELLYVPSYKTGHYTIPSSVTSIGENAFRNCSSLTSVTIPNSVTSIGDGAFYYCSSLTSITIPNSVTSIENSAFSTCTGLTSIIIPDSVTSIGNFSFNNNSNLTSIIIPDSVASIGENAFQSCSNLTSITFEGDAPSLTFNTNYSDTFNNSNPVAYYYYGSTGFSIPSWQGLTTEVLARTPPILNVETFYESQASMAVNLDATPFDGYPNYTYQWYFNGFPIPSFLDGTNATYSIDGASSSEGTWRVEVTNSAGMTSVEFEYRVFTDTDGDGLSDYRETNILGTDLNLVDSDSDGLNDFVEVNTHSTNPSLNDTDTDGLSDGDEVNTYSSNPLVSDSDGDGLTDGAEVITYSTDPNDTDSDDDQLSDADEVNTYLTNPNLSDTDSDQLSDYSEINSHFTDPNDSDSDDDSLGDGSEVNTYSTNPLLEDTTGDGFTDGFVVAQGADPLLDYSAFRTGTINQIKDLRVGSTIIEVSSGQADITMTLEETSDLNDWSSATTSEKTVQIDAPSGTRFYRFKLDD